MQRPCQAAHRLARALGCRAPLALAGRGARAPPLRGAPPLSLRGRLGRRLGRAPAPRRADHCADHLRPSPAQAVSSGQNAVG